MKKIIALLFLVSIIFQTTLYSQMSNNVIVFRPDHCSVTKIHVSADGMSLIEKGQEAVTVVK